MEHLPRKPRSRCTRRPIYRAPLRPTSRDTSRRYYDLGGHDGSKSKQ